MFIKTSEEVDNDGFPEPFALRVWLVGLALLQKKTISGLGGPVLAGPPMRKLEPDIVFTILSHGLLQHVDAATCLRVCF